MTILQRFILYYVKNPSRILQPSADFPCENRFLTPFPSASVIEQIAVKESFVNNNFSPFISKIKIKINL
jgi:hypothetical protein